MRKGIIGVVGILSKTELAAWPELFTFIGQATQHESADAREIGFLLLEEMSEVLGTEMESNDDQCKVLAPQINSLLERGLADGDARVGAAAVRAAGGLLSFLAETPQMDYFKGLLQGVISVADRLKGGM